jgi:Tfp pilus assembly protein FimT
MGRARVQFTMRKLLVGVAIVAAVMSMLVKPYLDRRHWSRRGAYHFRQSMEYLARAEAVETENPDLYHKLLQGYKWNQSRAEKFLRASNYGSQPPTEETPPPDMIRLPTIFDR